jgi:hypothetical protein
MEQHVQNNTYMTLSAAVAGTGATATATATPFKEDHG